MTGTVTPLTERAAWNALERHLAEIGDTHLRTCSPRTPTAGSG